MAIRDKLYQTLLKQGGVCFLSGSVIEDHDVTLVRRSRQKRKRENRWQLRAIAGYFRVEFSILSGVMLLALLPHAHAEDVWMTGSEVGALAFDQSAVQADTAVDLATLGFNAIPTAQMAAFDDMIYLDVTVNGEGRSEMFAFRQLPDGSLVMQADELRAMGILPVRNATDAEGWVNLAKLPQVSHTLREGRIVDFVTTDEGALAPYTTSLSPWTTPSNFQPLDEESRARSDFSAVVNYSLYANSSSERFGSMTDLDVISTTLEGRLSGKFGALFTSQILRYTPDLDSKFKTTRLDSYWRYSDETRLLTYQAGDLVTRSLSWSRSTRLGGFQVRRNFSLRNDLITQPMPTITGSAALPSSVDVYINNARVATKDVPTGPYSLTNMPVISGANDARIVVRDAMGRETVTNMAFFSTPEMLSKGVMDFSAELGVPRRNFGLKSGDYTGHLMASATLRYGFSDRLTVEGHSEAGRDLFNIGLGGTVSFGNVGSLSLAGSSSFYRSESGQQLYGALQLQRWGFYLNARTQRTYGHYNDISSVVDRRAATADQFVPIGGGLLSPAAYDYGDIRLPKAINQMSLSTNLRFDPTTFNVAYTEIDNWERDDSKFVSLSLSRNLTPRAYVYANAYIDLKESDRYGLFGGLSVSYDNGLMGSTGITSNHDGTSVTTQVGRHMGDKIGDYGWALRDTEGSRKQRSVEGRYRARFATLAASVEQYNEEFWRGTAQADGALVFADGALTPAHRIHDSFALVNAGVANVEVYSNNNYYGKTWRNGRLVVPNLSSYSTTSLKIDLDKLPVDTLVESSEIKVRPAHQGGVVANFGGSSSSNYAYVALQDQNGQAIPAGSYAELVGHDEGFDVGYDGMGIISLEDVRFPARLRVQTTVNDYCEAVIPATIAAGLSAGTQTLTCLSVAGLE